MTSPEYLRIKATLYQDLDLLKKNRKLNRREYTILTLRVYDTKLDEHLVQLQEEVQAIKENRTV